MALNLGKSTLLKNRLGGMLRGDFIIGQALAVEEAGVPSNTYPEGTLILNMAENRLYASITGATNKPDALHFKMNETTGTVMNDSSSGGHAGTLNNVAGRTSAGKYSWGIDTDQRANYITIADHADFDFNSDFTIEFWINLQSNQGAEEIIFSQETTGYILIGADGQRIKLWRNDAAAQTIWATTKTLTIGNWTHIAVVNDFTENKVKIYMDGVLELDEAIDKTLAVSGLLRIGRMAAGSGVDAILDEFKIFKSVRTVNQIKSDSLRSASLTWAYVDLTGA